MPEAKTKPPESPIVANVPIPTAQSAAAVTTATASPPAAAPAATSHPTPKLQSIAELQANYDGLLKKLQHATSEYAKLEKRVIEEAKAKAKVAAGDIDKLKAQKLEASIALQQAKDAERVKAERPLPSHESVPTPEVAAAQNPPVLQKPE